MRLYPIKVDMMDHCKGLALWLGVATTAKYVHDGEKILMSELLQVAGTYILVLAAVALGIRAYEISSHYLGVVRSWWRHVRVNDRTIY